MRNVLNTVSIGLIGFGTFGCVGPQTTWTGIGICLILIVVGFLMKGLVNYRG